MSPRTEADPAAVAPSEDEAAARERILDAAEAAFLKHGTAGARMQAIASEAGVNKALLHYYFTSKERLAAAVFQRAGRQFLPPIMHELGSDRPLPDKVRVVVGRYLDLLTRVPALPPYLVAEMHFHPERLPKLMGDLTGVDPRATGARILSTIQRQIDEESAAGRMRAMPARQFVTNLVSLCVFPFAARPMLTLLLGQVEGGFEAMIEERRHLLPEFFLKAVTP